MSSPSAPGENAFRGKSRIAFVSVASLSILALLTACGQSTSQDQSKTPPSPSNAVVRSSSTGSRPTAELGSTENQTSSAPAHRTTSGETSTTSGSKKGNPQKGYTMPDATTPFQSIGQSQNAASASSSPKAPTVSKTALEKGAGTSTLKPTEQQIVKPYLSQLASLQSQYINQLYSLYNQARAEYHTTHESKLRIEKKYFPEVLGLENSAQDKLNSLLFSLRDKLVASGYGAGEVDAIRNAYYAQMARLQSQIKG